MRAKNIPIFISPDIKILLNILKKTLDDSPKKFYNILVKHTKTERKR